MRRFAGLIVTLALVSLCALSLTLGSRVASAQGPGGGMPGGGGGMRPPGGFMPMAQDTFAHDRDSLLAELREHWAGKLDMPAESVFKHVEVFKGVPAKVLLGAMGGWGRALGVPCNHCHVLGHWADEDKKPKAIARGMVQMTSAINKDLLPQVKGLDDDAHVGCFTCHHGSAHPGGGMRPPGGGPGGPGGPGGERH